MPPENIIYGLEIFVSSISRWEWLFQGYISPSLIQLVRACSHLHSFFETGLFDWKEVVSWTPFLFLKKNRCVSCVIPICCVSFVYSFCFPQAP